MSSQPLCIQKLDPEAKIPVRAHADDAGLDLYCIKDALLAPHEPMKISTGVSMAIPHGFVGLICDRSSMGAKGIRTLGGVVDAGYRGEVQVLLINLKNEPYQITRGDKIAQMLVLPVSLCGVEEVDALPQTERSVGGFGSSGK